MDGHQLCHCKDKSSDPKLQLSIFDMPAVTTLMDRWVGKNHIVLYYVSWLYWEEEAVILFVRQSHNVISYGMNVLSFKQFSRTIQDLWCQILQASRQSGKNQ